ncbi:DUF2505 domain-containing protein [Demequina sp. SYSU T00192]|uniref:DUF2505 domain-containing protein n=1 Tax=Demequina litoralis TaxID=3051660 RepID=A0ABT8G6Z7_9MICO|nr:DUF2505 domain-containing protein [Demequina sp. SYSU T00192]MDN4474928.1 DUF2505 domain-containing protein [Demequina sp. SYSU T00192]
MKITHAHRFDAPLAEVWAMLTDVSFGHARAASMGTEAQDVDVDEREDGSFAITLRADVPTSSIPSEFRAFLGRDLAVTYTEVWEPPAGADDRVGTFAVEIAGAPGHVAGAIGLTPEGDTTEFLAAGDVTAHVPVVGAMIEKAVGNAVQRALTAQLEAADAWLAR